MNDNYPDIPNEPDSCGSEVLLVHGGMRSACSEAACHHLEQMGVECGSCEQLEPRIIDGGIDLVVIDCSNRAATDTSRIRTLRPDLPILALVDETSMKSVQDLLAAGVTNVHFLGSGVDTLQQRMDSLVGSEHGTDGDSIFERSLEILRGLCSTNSALSERVTDLESELAEVESDVASRVEIATVVSSFKALLSQELGVEGVLQTALEFILGRTGPTNAAIFLADSETSYSLGAYVNCDCPREKADPVLCKFTTDVCHHVAVPDDLVRFEDIDSFIQAVGPEAEILRSSEVIGMPCSSDGECLAVVFLFRSESDPFPEQLAPVLDAVRVTLAEQLATIVGIHHRIEDHWPDEPTDEASDWGFGTGGNKAA